MKSFHYLLVGGGISADSAARAIRALDPEGLIGLIGEEPDPPYNRPPLSKGLWKGQAIDHIWRGTETLHIDLCLGRKAIQVDPKAHLVLDNRGETYSYTKLLLATGGKPFRLPGDTGEQILYFRTLADYRRLREISQTARRIAVLGGGFIGSEIAAVLAEQGNQVSLLFLEDGIGARLFPALVWDYLNRYYTAKGVLVLPGRRVERITNLSQGLTVHTAQGDALEVDAIVAGLGIRPDLTLAQAAGLDVSDGILVDRFMRTSDPDIYACGDAVSFPSTFYGRAVRVEHEEHANQSGAVAGENMAGGMGVYDPIPYFYSTLFDLNYDAIGELDPSAEVYPDWIDPFHQGTLYYLNNGHIRGILLWNIPGRQEAAKQMIQSAASINPQDLTGRIRPNSPTAPRRVVRVIR